MKALVKNIFLNSLNFLLQYARNADIIFLVLIHRGLSSAGRALAWHARGRRFDPDSLHHYSEKTFATAKVFFISPKLIKNFQNKSIFPCNYDSLKIIIKNVKYFQILEISVIERREISSLLYQKLYNTFGPCIITCHHLFLS